MMRCVVKKSALTFVQARSGQAVAALDRAKTSVSSADLGWQGVYVESGYIDTWEVDELAPTAHYIALNTEREVLRFEAKVGGRFCPVNLPPGSVWVCPASESFTHRVGQPSGYAILTLDAHRVEQAGLGALALRRSYGIEHPALTHLIRALVAEVEHGGPSGPGFADAVTTAAIFQLAQIFGPVPQPSSSGGLSPAKLRRVLELLESRLAGGVSVAELAAEAGLSQAHFARAFKESVGRSPHQELVRRRIYHARDAILAGAHNLSDVAARFGFADQAHMTRLIKRELGVTPGALLKKR